MPSIPRIPDRLRPSGNGRAQHGAGGRLRVRDNADELAYVPAVALELGRRVNISAVAPRRLQPNRFVQNGTIPTADLYAEIGTRLNHVLYHRTKEFFRSAGYYVTWDPSTSGTAEKWRFRCRTGTMAKRFAVFMMIAPATAGATESSATFWATTGGATTAVQHHFGLTQGATDVIANCSQAITYLDCLPSTTYECVFSKGDLSRLVAVCVWEEALDPDVAYGYIAGGHSVQSPIYDTHRSELMVASTNAWKQNAAHLANFSVQNSGSPRTQLSATAENVLDGTSTSVSAASPGYYIDLRYRNTLSSSTVPCVFAAYFCRTGASGTVNCYLKDSTGATVATLSTSSTSYGWVAVAVNLPNTRDKYDVMIAGDGAAGTCSFKAFSLYQYEP